MTKMLVCAECSARGTATWISDGHQPNWRHLGVAELSRGFRYVDRGPQTGSYFVCTSCNAMAREVE